MARISKGLYHKLVYILVKISVSSFLLQACIYFALFQFS